MTDRKSVFITGANKGLGLQIAKDLGNKGFYVILSARNTERGRQAFHDLSRLGIECSFVELDVSDPQSIRLAFEQVAKMTRKLDVLINNAAILYEEGNRLLDTTPAAALAMLQTNSLGPLWVTQSALPLLKAGSRIIMISSSAGTFCEGVDAYAPLYSVSKTALNALTRHLHRELSGSGILINAMCPGWVRTDMGGPGANRSLEKGAETAVWLATEAPGSVNGQFLRDKKPIGW